MFLIRRFNINKAESEVTFLFNQKKKKNEEKRCALLTYYNVNNSTNNHKQEKRKSEIADPEYLNCSPKKFGSHTLVL